ncbi:Obscurin-like protein 1 like protein [Argiope bruennichi]|uniref:Obscurin-like protein 1 like protein n=1 Tax=Argiope bruennichi TaxID=94029 RepID=A0A8T0FXX4_ARGBR|nr:Obscurin-like protein 1 like protein [Argiope bruennichi]
MYLKIEFLVKYGRKYASFKLIQNGSGWYRFPLWYHNGRVLDEGEKKHRGIEVFTEFGPTSISRLYIAKAKESDSGNYSCQPSYAEPANITLQVLNVVEAYISEGPILYIKSGSPVNLTCHVKDQVGTVFLFWYHNGRVLDEGEKKHRGIEVFTEFGPTSISRLYIAKAKESDSGNYSCQPSYAEPANITLQVLNGEKPAAMQHGRKNDGFVTKASVAIIALLSFVFLI